MSEVNWEDLPLELYPTKFLNTTDLNSFRLVNHNARFEANRETLSRINHVYFNQRSNQRLLFHVKMDQSYKSIAFLNKYFDYYTD